ncbi:MAG: transketolase C-terminal domain-containing protein [Chlamydiota bacterium]
MRKQLAATLLDLAGRDPRIVLLTADLGFMVLEEFAAAYPDRFYNVGVAEADMAGIATGLAACGYIPFLYSIATFASMRGYEQLRDGPVLHRLPVRVLGIGGGFEYGHAGPTHAALEDLGIMRCQPGLTVIAPADDDQASAAIRAVYDLPGPVYFRISKENCPPLPGLDGRFTLGRMEILREGADAGIIAIGSIAAEAVRAAEMLAADGIRTAVGIVSSLRPAPADDIRKFLGGVATVVTVEEHYPEGGLGSLVAETAAGIGAPCRVVRLGAQFPFPAVIGSTRFLREHHGLSAENIARSVREGRGGGRP